MWLYNCMCGRRGGARFETIIQISLLQLDALSFTCQRMGLIIAPCGTVPGLIHSEA